jgi:hypothetical protein
MELEAAVNTAAFFAERRERADYSAFDKIMKRKGGHLTRTRGSDSLTLGRDAS